MGVFSKDYEKEAEELWEDVRNDLRPKDGFKHVLSISGASNTSKITGKTFHCTDVYDMMINTIIEKMQKYGYSIIDMKITDAYLAPVRTIIIYE